MCPRALRFCGHRNGLRTSPHRLKLLAPHRKGCQRWSHPRSDGEKGHHLLQQQVERVLPQQLLLRHNQLSRHGQHCGWGTCLSQGLYSHHVHSLASFETLQKPSPPWSSSPTRSTTHHVLLSSSRPTTPSPSWCPLKDTKESPSLNSLFVSTGSTLWRLFRLLPHTALRFSVPSSRAVFNSTSTSSPRSSSTQELKRSGK